MEHSCYNSFRWNILQRRIFSCPLFLIFCADRGEEGNQVISAVVQKMGRAISNDREYWIVNSERSNEVVLLAKGQVLCRRAQSLLLAPPTRRCTLPSQVRAQPPRCWDGRRRRASAAPRSREHRDKRGRCLGRASPCLV